MARSLLALPCLLSLTLAWQSAGPQPAGGRPELAGLLDFEAGIRAGGDEVLEAALRHILGPGLPAAVIERMAKQ